MTRKTVAPINDQLTFGPAPLRNSERDAFRREEQERCEEERRLSEQIAAEVLDRAFKAAHLDSKEVAFDLRVSVSLVDKWRSPEQRGAPSTRQLVLLGLKQQKFGFHLHREMNRYFGFGRKYLAHALDDIGALALSVER
jgi:hypothetical protein